MQIQSGVCIAQRTLKRPTWGINSLQGDLQELVGLRGGTTHCGGGWKSLVVKLQWGSGPHLFGECCIMSNERSKTTLKSPVCVEIDLVPFPTKNVEINKPFYC